MIFSFIHFLDKICPNIVFSLRHLVLFLPEGLNVIYPKSIAYRTRTYH